MRAPLPVRSEAGMTLVELLMAVAIMGIAVVSIVAAMGTSIIGTDRHRKQAQAHTVLLSAADSVKSQSYVPCATAGSYTPATGVTLPAGWTASYVTVQSVTYWNGLTFGPSACSPDPKLQLVKVQVATPDGRATESVSIVKRNPS